MPYVRLTPGKPWHYVNAGCNVCLCNAPINKRQRTVFTKALREGERLCLNCKSLLAGEQTPYRCQEETEGMDDAFKATVAPREAWQPRHKSVALLGH